MTFTTGPKESVDTVLTGPSDDVATHSPTVNISAIERAGRIAMGAGAAIVGAVLLTSASAILVIVLEVLLVVAGLDRW
jgi:hypothetical protein